MKAVKLLKAIISLLLKQCSFSSLYVIPNLLWSIWE